MKNTLSLDEISKIFGVSAHTILANQQREGFPKPKRGIYDLRLVVNWVVSRPNSKKSKMWLSASRILKELKDTENKELKDTESKVESAPGTTEKEFQKVTKLTTPKKNSSSVPQEISTNPDSEQTSQNEIANNNDVTSQLKPTVKKLSDIVDRYADLAKQSMDEENLEMSTYYMKMLVPSIEAMRKGIESCISVGKLRGDLLPLEDVQTAFTMMATNVRNQLLVMVKKLSHELLNIRTAGHVQRILEDEVGEVLENIAGNPFGS